MNDRKYTLTLAFKPGLSAEEIKKGQKELKEAVERNGGKVETQDSLGVKNLAYQVAGSSQASFERLAITLPAEATSDLRGELEKSNRFMRVLLTQEEKSR